jgi:hypothetical protein
MRRACLTALLAAALVPASAGAANPPPPPVPAIAQYVESLPTSAGPAVPGSGKPHSRALPTAVERTIRTQGGRDARTIEAIATSSAYGAPQTSLNARRPARQLPGTATPGAQRVAAAQIVSTDGGGNTRLVVLAALLGLATVALGAAGWRRRG